MLKTGVKQGDWLASTLFNLALHKVTSWVNPKGNIFVQICAYADEIVTNCEDMESLKNVYKVMAQEARIVGLIVNEGKTKYIKTLTSGYLNLSLIHI